MPTPTPPLLPSLSPTAAVAVAIAVAVAVAVAVATAPDAAADTLLSPPPLYLFQAPHSTHTERHTARITLWLAARDFSASRIHDVAGTGLSRSRAPRKHATIHTVRSVWRVRSPESVCERAHSSCIVSAAQSAPRPSAVSHSVATEAAFSATGGRPAKTLAAEAASSAPLA